MNIRNLDRGFVAISAVLAIVAYLFLIHTFPLRELIITLNGVFIGTMIALSFAYWRLLTDTVLGDEYNRARQMALGLFVAWLAYGLAAVSSIYTRALGIDIPSNSITVASRYAAIIAAALQITSPDFGLGPFFGRERKVLWLALAAGLVCAALTIYAQAEAVLSF